MMSSEGRTASPEAGAGRVLASRHACGGRKWRWRAPSTGQLAPVMIIAGPAAVVEKRKRNGEGKEEEERGKRKRGVGRWEGEPKRSRAGGMERRVMMRRNDDSEIAKIHSLPWPRVRP